MLTIDTLSLPDPEQKGWGVSALPCTHPTPVDPLGLSCDLPHR